MRGKAEASSAQTRAPKSVSTPHAIQTSRMSSGVPRWRAISDGWTKIEAPMIVPATIATAFVRVSDGASSATSVILLGHRFKRFRVHMDRFGIPIARHRAAG